MEWATPQVHTLYADDRGFGPRTHDNTGTFRHRWRAYRDPQPVTIELALDHRYQGLVAWVIDPSGNDPSALDETRGFPGGSPDRRSPASPHGTPSRFSPAAAALRRRRPPRRPHPPSRVDEVDVSGLGTVAFAASFIPTDVGTDRHVDELWLDDGGERAT